MVLGGNSLVAIIVKHIYTIIDL